MPMMSSPSEAEPSSVTLVSVPLPASLDGRQRHSTFLASRISRSWPPTPEVARRRRPSPLLFFVPCLHDERGLLRLEVDPVDGLGRASMTYGSPSGPWTIALRSNGVGAFGRLEREQVGRGDRDDAVQPVEAGVDLPPQRRDDGRG